MFLHFLLNINTQHIQTSDSDAYVFADETSGSYFQLDGYGEQTLIGAEFAVTPNLAMDEFTGKYILIEGRGANEAVAVE